MIDKENNNEQKSMEMQYKKLMLEEIKSKISQKINVNDPDFIKTLKTMIADESDNNINK